MTRNSIIPLDKLLEFPAMLFRDPMPVRLALKYPHGSGIEPPGIANICGSPRERRTICSHHPHLLLKV